MNGTNSNLTPRTELSTYAYSYPHKSSYRRLSPPVPIAEAWREEDVRRLSLYVHVPFCEMRCGFCNLFTQSQPVAETVEAYLATLFRQMRVVREAVPGASFSQFAIGGGTPTYLAPAQLESLLRRIETTFGQSVADLSASVETSPATATLDRLRVLAQFGVRRISLGVQSFVSAEARQIGRPQRVDEVHRALAAIRECGFPVMNLDLIYGDPLQTEATWMSSLGAALGYRPEELYLYPLYIRPQTGLANAGARSVEHRADLYLAARALLLERGYLQSSLRCFRLPSAGIESSYLCQRDGMLGLGCGARSYTGRLHYATRFAASQAGVRAILRQWIAQSNDELSLATHGFWLSDEEQSRRFVIMSLLQLEGLSIADTRARFPRLEIERIPRFSELIERRWVKATGDRYLLTTAGMQNSDTVGPMLYSESVLERLQAFVETSELAAAGERR